MADAPKAPLTWPTASWKMLKKIVRAWYTAEESGGEITQRGIAKIANVQASRVSMNKPFLQTIGIVQPEGIALTEGGKNLGLGVSNENEKVTQQALQRIIRENALLRQLLDIIKGRGTTDRTDFEAEVLILTKQGKGTPFFS